MNSSQNDELNEIYSNAKKICDIIANVDTNYRLTKNEVGNLARSFTEHLETILYLKSMLEQREYNINKITLSNFDGKTLSFDRWAETMEDMKLRIITLYSQMN